MSINYELKIICGLHRSGTTYTSKILSRSDSVQIIHEPCNPDWGVYGVNQWYPYLDPETNDRRTKVLIDDIFHFRRRWNRQPPRKLKLISHLFYKTVGGRQGLIWSQLRLRHLLHSLPTVICWKDPFVTFALGHILPAYKAKAVCMIRHPGALWYSNRKLNWTFDITRLLSQKTLVERYGNDISKKQWELATPKSPASIAILWKIMARMISEQMSLLPSLIAVRHEDLCVQTTDTTGKICDHLNIPFSKPMQQYIGKTTSGSSIEASQGIVHSFNRNSRHIINSWKKNISIKEERIIRDVIGEDFEKFYESW
ncbi:MAG: sulfotransferase [Leptolyngbya sp. SIO3F4]|nr:sulfotransferase [Leptolyngbya sp. SIO3F4]